MSPKEAISAESALGDNVLPISRPACRHGDGERSSISYNLHTDYLCNLRRGCDQA